MRRESPYCATSTAVMDKCCRTAQHCIRLGGAALSIMQDTKQTMRLNSIGQRWQCALQEVCMAEAAFVYT